MAVGITYIQKYGPLEIESKPLPYNNSRIKEHTLLIEHNGDRHNIGTFSPNYMPQDFKAVSTMLVGTLAFACATKAFYSLISEE